MCLVLACFTQRAAAQWLSLIHISQPPAGRSLAKGVRFEQISEAYRTVAHDNPLTDEQQQETGRTLLGLKQTDMFEAIVSAAPDGNDKVSRLIDAYLTAFQRRIAANLLKVATAQTAKVCLKFCKTSTHFYTRGRTT